MLTAKPSSVKPYDLYVRKDPVFTPEPTDPEALATYARAWKIARATGNYDPVIAEGKQLGDATRFSVRPLAGDIVRKLGGLTERIGVLEFQALVVRCALVDVSNFGDATIKLGTHEDGALANLGTIATRDITNRLDQLDLGIVADLFWEIWERAQGLSPS